MTKNDKFPMTKVGKEKLEAELSYLISEKQGDVLTRIKKARTFCDFNEDSEFDEALKEQASVEERILLLKHMIYNAEIIKSDSDNKTVSIGKKITFIEQPDGKEETYTIVGLAEADPSNGMISDQSPLAKSLLGHKLNEKVFVNLPGDRIKVIITQVE